MIEFAYNNMVKEIKTYEKYFDITNILPQGICKKLKENGFIQSDGLYYLPNGKIGYIKGGHIYRNSNDRLYPVITTESQMAKSYFIPTDEKLKNEIIRLSKTAPQYTKTLNLHIDKFLVQVKDNSTCIYTKTIWTLREYSEALAEAWLVLKEFLEKGQTFHKAYHTSLKKSEIKEKLSEKIDTAIGDIVDDIFDDIVDHTL